MLTDIEVEKKYGKAGDERNFKLITLPYPMRYVVSKNEFVEVKTMRCHKLVADRFTLVFKDILSHYGLAKIKELGIDFFGGCVAVRLMRGSKNRWSRHSWGIAIDLDPLRNTLKETSKTARFAKPEYKPMIDIFYKHGFISYGRERNYDWMHFESL